MALPPGLVPAKEAASVTETIYKCCSKCQVVRTADHFHKDAKMSDGLQNWCINCVSSYGKRRRVKDSREPWRHQLIAKYGITHEQYEKMLFHQNGLCAICGSKQSHRGSDHLFVDHCHKTGKVRALLCHGCNAGIGQLREDPQILENAILYLKKHNA